MGKLIVLKIIDGSFEQGFSVMLQIGEEGAPATLEVMGKLPALPEMPLYYSRWRETYWRLDARYRITAKTNQKANVSLIADCQHTAQILKARLNGWLLTEEFRTIRERWLERVAPDEELRVIVQTENSQLRQLPWNLLDFLERYPKAEIALSALNTEELPPPPPKTSAAVNILTILGNSDGINTDEDKAFLQSLPNVALTTLVEPDRKTLTDTLWKRSWDILFFAGHSSSLNDREAGRIFLNHTDSLTISELKYALRNAVSNGLRLAIFNSCDGLGLARELADLHIPHVIIMREPVPDLIAQEFLKAFLTAYARGTSLPLAMRQARERLQGMEDRFPCASWLPLICQPPTAIPPTWANLLPAPAPQPQPFVPKRRLFAAALASMTIAGLTIGLRSLGLLQRPEWAAYDQMLQLRPSEPPDPRLFVVTIDDADLEAQRQTSDLGGASISDANLERLLTLLNRYQPRAIGLDLHRTAATNARQYPDLARQLKTNDTLITICKLGYTKANPYGTPAPPDVPTTSFRTGFSDFVTDPDGTIRRHLLAMNTEGLIDSHCHFPTAFSVELVLRYFQVWNESQTGFHPDWGNALQLHFPTPTTALPTIPHGYPLAPARSPQTAPYNIQFPGLTAQHGTYQGQGVDTNGVQLLLNYRKIANAEPIANYRPLRWFLDPTKPPSDQELKQLIHNKIVLIGVTAWDKRDYAKVPTSINAKGEIAGVFVHAHMISQLLSTTLDGRPLLWTWPAWGEWLWIGSWAVVGGAVVLGISTQPFAQKEQIPQIALAVGCTVGLLYGTCAGVLVLVGGWLPFVPAAIALTATSLTVTLFPLHPQPDPRLDLVYSH